MFCYKTRPPAGLEHQRTVPWMHLSFKTIEKRGGYVQQSPKVEGLQYERTSGIELPASLGPQLKIVPW